MIMWYKDNTVYRSQDEIRRLYPDTSFPLVLGPDLLESLGFEEIVVDPIPDYDSITHKLVEQHPIRIDNILHQTWTVIECLPEEVEANKFTARSNMIATPFQATAALHQQGLLDDVNSLMNNPSTDPLLVIAWQKASEFKRLSPAILNVASILGWTEEQLDELFKLAVTLET